MGCFKLYNTLDFDAGLCMNILGSNSAYALANYRSLRPELIIRE